MKNPIRKTKVDPYDSQRDLERKMYGSQMALEMKELDRWVYVEEKLFRTMRELQCLIALAEHEPPVLHMLTRKDCFIEDLNYAVKDINDFLERLEELELENVDSKI